MKQEALFKKLGNILSELNEQYQFLSKNPEQLSELELELFLANANFLSDHIHIIKKLNLNLQVNQLTTKATEERIIEEEIGDELRDVQQLEAITFANTKKLEEELENLTFTNSTLEEEDETMNGAQQDSPMEIVSEQEIFRLDNETSPAFEFTLNTTHYTDNDRFEFEEKTPDELFDRPLTDEEALILEQKRKVKENLIRETEDLDEDEIGPEPFLVHREEVEAEELPIIEIPQVRNEVQIEELRPETEFHKPTLNEILAANKTTGRVNETSGATIADLKAAINLNDKLLYIKDLFNGYNLAYAEAIDIVNKMPNFDAADNFLQKNYAVKNNWADKQLTVDKFYLLLNRRFRD